ncbi:hypothetical protein BOTBODRAFT_185906 [Botryobasidium botryosum FD-172 SS1]|uniref:Uncharacterized protein n=1 Tax=Botryobasidium botryosum (strain FD-172 SS1) TaxID=930990 RepID=A0A067MZ46_BOTB1|nr:hypothetical protein BOTBODRAFT_185906 [Botryobasidium botryosum FD-172 SS1]
MEYLEQTRPVLWVECAPNETAFTAQIASDIVNNPFHRMELTAQVHASDAECPRMHVAFVGRFDTPGMTPRTSDQVIGHKHQAYHKIAMKRSLNMFRVILQNIELCAFTGDVPFASTHLYAVVNLAMKGVLPDRPTDPHTISLGLDNRMWEIVTDCSSHVPAHRLSAQTVISRLLTPASSRQLNPRLSTIRLPRPKFHSNFR